VSAKHQVFAVRWKATTRSIIVGVRTVAMLSYGPARENNHTPQLRCETSSACPRSGSETHRSQSLASSAPRSRPDNERRVRLWDGPFNDVPFPLQSANLKGSFCMTPLDEDPESRWRTFRYEWQRNSKGVSVLHWGIASTRGVAFALRRCAFSVLRRDVSYGGANTSPLAPANKNADTLRH
jgi:hypothetical protein